MRKPILILGGLDRSLSEEEAHAQSIVADSSRSLGRDRRPGRLGGKFEVAPPGKPEEFKTYLKWTTKRKPS